VPTNDGKGSVATMQWEMVAIALVAYFIGSFPAAYLLARRAGGVDVREEGEGNVGARNVFHVVGPRWGIVAFLADFGKGVAVGLIVLGDDWPRLAVAGTFVLLGHAFPLWLGFVGGKGLSTVGGFTALVMPVAVLIGGAGAAVAWLATRRFMPTTVVAIVLAIVAAPITGVELASVGVVVWLFALTGVKRALDESRMQAVEAVSGWDRVRGLGS
jgi:glycerol-3-phosphate acyltransferase PlsY